MGKLLIPHTIQARLQFPRPGFGLPAGFPLPIHPRPIILGPNLRPIRPRPLNGESSDMPSRFRVMPSQLAVFPARQEVQYRAVALYYAAGHSRDGNRLVGAVY